MKHGRNSLSGALMTIAAVGAMLLASGCARADVLVRYPVAAVKGIAKSTRAVAQGGERCAKAAAHGTVRAVKSVEKV